MDAMLDQLLRKHANACADRQREELHASRTHVDKQAVELQKIHEEARQARGEVQELRAHVDEQHEGLKAAALGLETHKTVITELRETLHQQKVTITELTDTRLQQDATISELRTLVQQQATTLSETRGAVNIILEQHK